MRVIAAIGYEEGRSWSVATSVGLHGLLLVALLLSPAVRRQKRPEEDRVTVEIVSPGEFQAALVPRAAPEKVEAPAAQPALPAPITVPRPPLETPGPDIVAPPAMIRPTQMLSAKTLADPRSRQGRADLATFSESERVTQLCNIEAMDQIRQWRKDFQPEQVVSYATANEKTVGNTLIADGAAFRSKANWYSLKFRCELAGDGENVVGFEFLVGDPVPREKWDELDLPAVH